MSHHERPPLALQLIFLGKHLDHLMEHKLAVHGLNRTQALTLMALQHHEGLNAMALCAHARVEPANVTRTLQTLERLDLVERRPHPTDGRAQLFYLTAGGQSMAETVGLTMRQISTDMLGNMDNEEVGCLEIGLKGLRRTIRRQLEVDGSIYQLSALSSQLAANSEQQRVVGPQPSVAGGQAGGRNHEETGILRGSDPIEDNSDEERRRLTADS